MTRDRWSHFRKSRCGPPLFRYPECHWRFPRPRCRSCPWSRCRGCQNRWSRWCCRKCRNRWSRWGCRKCPTGCCPFPAVLHRPDPSRSAHSRFLVPEPRLVRPSTLPTTLPVTFVSSGSPSRCGIFPRRCSCRGLLHGPYQFEWPARSAGDAISGAEPGMDGASASPPNQQRLRMGTQRGEGDDHRCMCRRDRVFRHRTVRARNETPRRELGTRAAPQARAASLL